MADSEPTADSLVAEGIRLYQEGQLERALSAWRRALDEAPGLALAKQYIDYVEGNWEALQAAFSANNGEAAADATIPQPALEQTHLGADDDGAPELLPDEAVDLEPDDLSEHQDDADDFVMVEVEASRLSAPGLPKIRVPPVTLAAPDPEPAFVDGEPYELTADACTPATMSRARATVDSAVLRIDFGESPSEEILAEHANDPTLPRSGARKVEAPAAFDQSRLPRGPSTASQPAIKYKTPTADQVNSDGQRIQSMLEGAQQLFDRGSYEGSFQLCERILSFAPADREAQRLVRSNRAALLAQYRDRIHDLTMVPVVQLSQQDILWRKLDHRAGFLLSRIDGSLSFADVLDISGMNEFEALRILCQLLEAGVIAQRR